MAECISFPEQNTVIGIGDCDPAKVVPMSAWVGEDQTGTPMSVSCWKLNEAEINEVVGTGVVWQGIMGKGIPPSYIAVFSPFQPHSSMCVGMLKQREKLKVLAGRKEPARKWKPIEWNNNADDSWTFDGLDTQTYIVHLEKGDWQWACWDEDGDDEVIVAGSNKCGSADLAKAEAEKHFYAQLDALFAKWSI